MATPVYFIAGHKADSLFPGERVDREVLRKLGMADLWRDTLADKAVDWLATEWLSNKTPGNTPGMFVSALPVESHRPPRTVTQFDDGSWRWLAGENGVWLGIDTLAPVKPEDVERRNQYKGHWVELADGNEWLIPVIRRPVWGQKTIKTDDGEDRQVDGFLDGIPRLSQIMTMDPATRRVTRSIRPVDQRIWDWSASFYPLVYSDGFNQTAPLPQDEETFAFAASLLAMNYRVGLAEINAWQLFEDRVLIPVIQAAMDLPWIKARDEATTQKKT